MILVRPAFIDGGPDKLLADLGYEKRRKIQDVPFSRSGARSIWIGAIGDCVILDTLDAWAFFSDDRALDVEAAHFKRTLLQHFSEMEVAALVLHSVVDAWGFAVYQRGTLIRRQHGDADGVDLDEGALLPVEGSYLTSINRSDGEFDMRGFGEEFVLEICRSFTGYRLDTSEFDKAIGADFWLNDDESKFLTMRARASWRVQRPWWKFWR